MSPPPTRQSRPPALRRLTVVTATACALVVATGAGAVALARQHLLRHHGYAALENVTGRQRRFTERALRQLDLALQAPAAAARATAAARANFSLHRLLARERRLARPPPDDPLAPLQSAALRAAHRDPPFALEAGVPRFVALALAELEPLARRRPPPPLDAATATAHTAALVRLAEARLLPGYEALTAEVEREAAAATRTALLSVGAVGALGTGLLVAALVALQLSLGLTLRRQLEADAAGERQRAAAQAATRLLLQNAFEGVCIHQNGVVIEANPAMAAMFGVPLERLVGHNIDAMLSPEVLARLRSARGAGLDGEVWHDAPVTRPDGSTVVLEWRGRPCQYDGAAARVVNARDVTAARAAAAAMQQARLEAEGAARSKADFLANMSHEIRTPLNGILGMADLLLETPLAPEQQRYATIVHRSGSQLLRLINDILDMSKLDAGKMELEANELHLQALVEGQAELVATRALEREVMLHVFVDPCIPESLRGDGGRIGQILLNFLSNAIKFTERGTVVLKAECAAVTEAATRVRFTVQDSGIGMSEAVQARLFAPFSQADASTARRYGGSGLGLSICRRLATLMGGEVGVHSAPGQGATFWCELPLLRPELSAAPTPGRLAEVELAGLRVLLVDGDGVWRTIAASYLRTWGVQVEQADSGAAALAALAAAHARGDPLAAVYTERRLADTDGFALAAAIRRQPGGAGLPLLLVTSLHRVSQREDAQRAGFAAYLTKPVRRDDLRESLALTQACAVEFARPESVTAPAAAPPAEPRLRVLVAEDNAVNQLLVMSHLSKLGYAAAAVGSGSEVLQALDIGAYDLVLMDCQMPEMDGFEATRRIRQQEQGSGRHLPIIALTANAMKEDAARCLQAGMDGHLAKPIRKDLLAAALAPYLTSA